jgi:hypothetical protein
MELLAGGLLLIGAVVALEAWRRSSHRKAVAAWDRAAKALGLAYPAWAREEALTMAGRLDEFRVTVETVPHENKETRTRIALSSKRIDPSVRFGREGGVEALEMLFAGPDVRVGAPEFDDHVHADGPEATVLALMGRLARPWVKELIVDRHGRVERGTLLVEVPGIVQDSGEIVRLVRHMADVARGLILPPAEIPRALADNATGDPVPGVRRRNMRLLVEQFPKSEWTLRAAGAVIGDADPNMRLLAAMALGGDRAREVFLGILKDEAATPGIRVAALEQLRAGRDPRVVDAVCEVATGAPAELARLAAVTLMEVGDSRAEPKLIELLAHASVEVRVAAAEALGLVGTVRAVEPLLPLREGVLASATLKEAARNAVRTIQERLGEVEGGAAVARPAGGTRRSVEPRGRGGRGAAGAG